MRQKKLFIDGLNMNVAAAGSGRPVVFIHGLGWDHTLWLRQLGSLSTRYAVVAPDTRGHGGSDKPPGPYSIAQFASDYAGLLDCLQLGPACVVGFSQGGLVAQMLALERPDLVGALVLAGTSCRGGAGDGNMAARQNAMQSDGPRAAARLAAETIFFDSWRAAHADDVEAFIEHRVGADHAALKAAMHAGRGVDMTARLASLQVPTLVIGAEADKMMPVELSRLLARSIPGARLEVLADTGHMIPIERPQAFDALLNDFLKQHWPAGQTQALQGAQA